MTYTRPAHSDPFADGSATDLTVVLDALSTGLEAAESTLVTVREGPLDIVGRYGVDNTGAAACQTQLQTALDALKNTSGDGNRSHGAAGFLRPGRYYLTGSVTIGANVELVGSGGSGDNLSLGLGATILDVHTTSPGITADGSSETGSAMYRGPILRNLSFYGSSTNAKGLLYTAVNNFKITDCTFANFSGASGYGFKSVGPYNQYGEIRGTSFLKCLTAIDLTHNNGLRIFGGYFTGSGTNDSLAINVVDGNGITVVGSTFYNHLTAVNVATNHEAASFIGCRFENFYTGITSDAYGTAVDACSFNNNGQAPFVAGTDVAVALTSNSQRAKIFPSVIRSVTTTVTNAGGTNLWLNPVTNEVHGMTVL